MRVEDELLAAAGATEDESLRSLLTRAADEIRQLRETQRGKLSAAMQATSDTQGPP
jgi:hypothetical protein